MAKTHHFQKYKIYGNYYIVITYGDHLARAHTGGSWPTESIWPGLLLYGVVLYLLSDLIKGIHKS